MFRSCLAFSKPAAARSLNDLSPRPPTSYASPTLRDFLVGVLAPAGVLPPPPPPVDLLLPPPLLPHAARAIEAATTSTPSFKPRSLRKTDRLTLEFHFRGRSVEVVPRPSHDPGDVRTVMLAEGRRVQAERPKSDRCGTRQRLLTARCFCPGTPGTGQPERAVDPRARRGRTRVSTAAGMCASGRPRAPAAPPASR